MPLPSEEVTPPVTKTNLGTAVDLRGFSNSSAERTEKRAIGLLFHRKRKAVQHHQARALGSATGRIRRNVHVLVGSRVLEPPVETQSAEARVAQLTVANGAVFDDGAEPRAEEPKTGPQHDRSGEGRSLDREVSRRFVEPGPEIRGDVRVARERDRAVVAARPTEDRSRPATIVDDERSHDDIRAGGDVALEPLGRARSRDIRSVAAFGDDPLEAVLGDDLEERLAVVLEVLGHGEHPAAEPGGGETAATFGKRTIEQRPAILVENVERHEDRAASAFRGFRPEPPGEKVVARASARIADDDLAVQEGAIRDAHVPKLGDRREEIATGAIDQAQARAITRKERPDAVPLQLEEVVRRVEGTPGEPGTHRHDGTREPALRVPDVDERRMLRAVRRTALTRHQPRIGRGSPG